MYLAFKLHAVCAGGQTKRNVHINEFFVPWLSSSDVSTPSSAKEKCYKSWDLQNSYDVKVKGLSFFAYNLVH